MTCETKNGIAFGLWHKPKPMPHSGSYWKRDGVTVTPSRLQSNQTDRIGDLKNVHEKFLDILYPFIILMVIFIYAPQASNCSCRFEIKKKRFSWKVF